MDQKRPNERDEKLVPRFSEWSQVEPAKGHWLTTIVELLSKRDAREIGFLVAVAGVGLIGRDLAQGGAVWAALSTAALLAAVGSLALYKGGKWRGTSAEGRADDQAEPGDR
jgi:hypothetical protein